jgi:predicted RNase H-like HicB family nuclease
VGARRPVIKRIARADKFDFTIVLEPQIERGFTVSVLPLPEVVAEGDTEIEAMA